MLKRFVQPPPARAGRSLSSRLPVWCLLVLLLAGCGGSSAAELKAATPQWTYAPGAVKLRYRSDKRLNEYDGRAHTVAMCVYQLSKPNAFNTLSKTKKGLLKLLQCKSFDPSVVYYEIVYAQPGEDRLDFLDRAEDAKYMGVAAGYNLLEPRQSTRLFQYPVETKTTGMFFTSTSKHPGKVFVNLFLGPFGIQKVGSN